MNLARKSVQLEPNLPQAQAAFAYALIWKGENDAAVAAYERAKQRNSNFTDVRFLGALVIAGDHERAIAESGALMRFDPFYLPQVLNWLGLAHYMLKRYEEALPLFRECVARAPNFLWGHIWVAAICSHFGRLDEARRHTAEVFRIDPTLTIKKADSLKTRLGAQWKYQKDTDHYLDGLRRAGLPDS